MPKTQTKPGRPPALSGNAAALTVFAMGKGLDVRDVAAAAGVSSRTAQRLFNNAILATDPRCQRLMRLIHEHEQPSAGVVASQFSDTALDCDAF